MIGIIACITAIFIYTDVSGPTDAKGELTPTKTETSEFTCSVVGTNYECSSWSNKQYPIIELFEEKYVPLFSNHEEIWNAHTDKIAKLILDLFPESKSCILTSGESIDCSEGYILKIKRIDVNNQKVWLELTNDGELIDDNIISVTDDGTWNVEVDDVQGVDDVLVFKVHVSKISQSGTDSTVQFDGLWLIDYVNAKTIKPSDRFGNLKIKEIISGEDESNLGGLVFEQEDT
ncbi:hypothetical protein ASJ81_09980 [Methanosarcina spelaei]|uniref:S-layer family duplication domain-containing protein n=1 Tax=Methanosarcina spelaei TaxID=1036679 RepID=A0A2A2HPX5_9EURY|nr:hypothetical protein ASJ81_09980 [Methanosarcina spelaei]